MREGKERKEGSLVIYSRLPGTSIGGGVVSGSLEMGYILQLTFVHQ